jgi:hypothetical protein
MIEYNNPKIDTRTEQSVATLKKPMALSTFALGCGMMSYGGLKLCIQWNAANCIETMRNTVAGTGAGRSIDNILTLVGTGNGNIAKDTEVFKAKITLPGGTSAGGTAGQPDTWVKVVGGKMSTDKKLVYVKTLARASANTWTATEGNALRLVSIKTFASKSNLGAERVTDDVRVGPITSDQSTSKASPSEEYVASLFSTNDPLEISSEYNIGGTSKLDLRLKDPKWHTERSPNSNNHVGDAADVARMRLEAIKNVKDPQKDVKFAADASDSPAGSSPQTPSQLAEKVCTATSDVIPSSPALTVSTIRMSPDHGIDPGTEGEREKAYPTQLNLKSGVSQPVQFRLPTLLGGGGHPDGVKALDSIASVAAPDGSPTPIVSFTGYQKAIEGVMGDKNHRVLYRSNNHKDSIDNDRAPGAAKHEKVGELNKIITGDEDSVITSMTIQGTKAVATLVKDGDKNTPKLVEPVHLNRLDGRTLQARKLDSENSNDSICNKIGTTTSGSGCKGVTSNNDRVTGTAVLAVKTSGTNGTTKRTANKTGIPLPKAFRKTLENRVYKGFYDITDAVKGVYNNPSDYILTGRRDFAVHFTDKDKFKDFAEKVKNQKHTELIADLNLGSETATPEGKNYMQAVLRHIDVDPEKGHLSINLLDHEALEGLNPAIKRYNDPGKNVLVDTLKMKELHDKFAVNLKSLLGGTTSWENDASDDGSGSGFLKHNAELVGTSEDVIGGYAEANKTFKDLFAANFPADMSDKFRWAVNEGDSANEIVMSVLLNKEMSSADLKKVLSVEGAKSEILQKIFTELSTVANRMNGQIVNTPVLDAALRGVPSFMIMSCDAGLVVTGGYVAYRGYKGDTIRLGSGGGYSAEIGRGGDEVNIVERGTTKSLDSDDENGDDLDSERATESKSNVQSDTTSGKGGAAKPKKRSTAMTVATYFAGVSAAVVGGSFLANYLGFSSAGWDFLRQAARSVSSAFGR